MTQEKIFDLVSRFVFILGTFLSPTVPLLMIVGLAILIDTLAGRWAASFQATKDGKIPREEVTSKKTRQGVVEKSVSYSLVVLTFYCIDYAILNEVVVTYIPWQHLATKIVVLFICWIEYDSIDEKYYRVKGYRIKDKFHEFIRSVKKSVKSIFKFKDLFDEEKK